MYNTTSKFGGLNQDLNKEIGWSIHNPYVQAGADAVSFVGNVPIRRYVQKSKNVEETLDARNNWWQRFNHFMGASAWDMGTKVEKLDAIKGVVGQEREARGVEKSKQTRKVNKVKEEAKIAKETKGMTAAEKFLYTRKAKYLNRYKELPSNWDKMSIPEQDRWIFNRKKEVK